MNKERYWNKYSDLEKNYAERLRKLTDTIENPVIKAILEGFLKIL